MYLHRYTLTNIYTQTQIHIDIHTYPSYTLIYILYIYIHIHKHTVDYHVHRCIYYGACDRVHTVAFSSRVTILIPHFACTRPIAAIMYDIRVNKLLLRSIYLSRDNGPSIVKSSESHVGRFRSILEGDLPLAIIVVTIKFAMKIIRLAYCTFVPVSVFFSFVPLF